MSERPLSFQDLILRLHSFWSKQGCVILQPYDVEMGAGTFHPATTLRALGPKPWAAAYVQPSRRPTDGRYGENPNRLQHYYQYQVIMKPSPADAQALLLESYREIGLNPLRHDFRFVEDDWESPTLGAWGLGWEVWCDGMEVGQFTYFQQVGGIPVTLPSFEMTYGLERLAMYVQDKENVYDLDFNDAGVKYGDVFLRAEREYSAHNFEFSNPEMLSRHFADAEAECASLLTHKLALPAYDQCIKASHLFNLLDARGVISVTERASYIGRVRALAKSCCEAWVAGDVSAMAEFFLELFSEEIPARMQARGADDLARLTTEALAGLSPKNVRTWYGPRRIALAADIEPGVAAAGSTERGPRVSAPEQALLGFLRKHNAAREQVRREGDYWVLEKQAEAVAAPALIASAIPSALRKMPWPKSMRWGGTSQFVWVRPLRRIVCLLDGEIVPFELRDGADDGHGLASFDLTEGHRFHAPGTFAVSGAADWAAKLRAHQVMVDVADRKQAISARLAAIAAEKSITIVDDPGLLDEVAGLVEWPVPLAGRIADEHMDLPAEVMQVSMRVNQRYFAARTPDNAAAPSFLFVANIEAEDHGAAIVAGNERVLRARFSDARHFWDLDRKTRLDTRVPFLDHVTYHAKLGSQGARVMRLRRLAETIAPLAGAEAALANRAAELAKADLVSGMVGEFPELQGVMGRYYALNDQEDAAVADAIRDHYAPRGPSDPVPSAPVSIAVALADKIDQLACFFAIDERPTGAGDPYALRRAALGVIRIIRENGLRLRLLPLLDQAIAAARAAAGEHAPSLSNDRVLRALNAHPGAAVLRGSDGTARVTRPAPGTDKHTDLLAFDILEFLAERLRVQLRTEGARHDVPTAVFAAGADDDISRLLRRTDAVRDFLALEDGANLLAAYRRAANILRIEERKDGPHSDAPDSSLLNDPAEEALHRAVIAGLTIEGLVREEKYAEAMTEMAKLRPPLDVFFEKVTVNATEPNIRRNRLRLLNQVRTTMDRVADFSRIEG